MLLLSCEMSDRTGFINVLLILNNCIVCYVLLPPETTSPPPRHTHTHTHTVILSCAYYL
jgi:hypothetical protein